MMQQLQQDKSGPVGLIFTPQPVWQCPAEPVKAWWCMLTFLVAFLSFCDPTSSMNRYLNWWDEGRLYREGKIWSNVSLNMFEMWQNFLLLCLCVYCLDHLYCCPVLLSSPTFFPFTVTVGLISTDQKRCRFLSQILSAANIDLMKFLKNTAIIFFFFLCCRSAPTGSNSLGDLRQMLLLLKGTHVATCFMVFSSFLFLFSEFPWRSHPKSSQVISPPSLVNKCDWTVLSRLRGQKSS